MWDQPLFGPSYLRGLVTIGHTSPKKRFKSRFTRIADYGSLCLPKTL